MPDANIPNHIGMIMDGNRRWAAERGLKPIEGHKAGFEALFALIPAIKQFGIPYVTIYAFSAENWLRSAAEVKGILRLLQWVVQNRLKALVEADIRVQIIGAREGLPKAVAAALDHAEAETANCRSLTLSVCFNYGGQQEIVDAVKKIQAEGVPASDVTTENFAKYLYAPHIPPMDLVVRTSGEQRLSNFMLWRAAYSEFMFTDTKWPDFTAANLAAILEAYAGRQRRFGK